MERRGMKILGARLVIRLSAACTALFLSLSQVQAVECRYCEGRDLDELLALSATGGSDALRAQIRGWLAEKHPDTSAGHAGRAWIGAANGLPDDAVIDLYLRAIEINPDNTLPYVNGSFALRGAERLEEAVALLRKGLARGLGLKEPYFARNLYFYTKELHGPEAAERFLVEALGAGQIRDWHADYVLGVVARGAGDRARADQLFERAMDRGATDEIVTDWLENNLRLLAARRADRSQRYDALRRAIVWARDHGSAQVMYSVAETLSEEFEAYRDAFALYREAYDMGPLPEAAARGFGAWANSDFPAALALLKQAERDFGDNAEILETLTWAHYNFVLEPEEAHGYGKAAIAAAPRQLDLVSAIRVYATFLEVVAEHDTAAALFEANLPRVKGRQYNSLLGDYLDNRLYAGAFDHAARLLAQAEERPNMSASWLAVRRNRLETALRLHQQRARYYADFPFLAQWQDRFGDSLRVTVEFATGKADIRPEGRGVLDTAADVLTSPGAEDFVFLIEGHTDSRGSDAINLPLSQARAKAVRSYFSEQRGIAPARLQTVGFGPRNPLASNETEAGRQTNRRVEIRPYGNIATPRVTTSGWLDPRSARTSRDGRIAVTGHTPTQVWDLERGVRLHQLPLGSMSREISPNGRYLAAKSSFQDATGTSTHAMFIYDLRTGLAHDQILLPETIDEISWSPFSDELAWTDRHGFLRIYDLAERRIRGVVRMGTIRGSQEMVWLPDGSRIVTKVPRSEMVFWNARTLEKDAVFRDPGWLHALEATADGKYVVAVSNDYEMIVWDAKEMTELHRVRLPLSGFIMEPHPTKPMMMLTSGFENDIGMALIEVPSGKIVASRGKGQGISGSFTPDGAYFVGAEGDEIITLDTRTMQVARQMRGIAHKGQSVAVVEATNLLLSRDAGGTSVWSLETGRRVHRLDRDTGFGWKPQSADGAVLFNVDDDGNLITFDTRSFTEEVALRTGLNVKSVDATGDYIALAAAPGGEEPYRNPRAEIVVLDRTTLREVMRTTTDLVTEPVRYGDIYRPQLRVRVAENGLVALHTSWTDGYRQNRTDGKVISIFDAQTGREITGLSAKRRGEDLKWEAGGAELWFHEGTRWTVFDPRSGKELRKETPQSEYVIEMADGRSLSWFWDHVALDGQEVTFPYSLRDLEVHEGRNLAVGMTTANEIVFIDLNSMKLTLTIAPKKNGEWIAYAPDGRYTASLNGSQGVYWSLGDNYLPFEALSDKFERPNLVRKLLEAVAGGRAEPDQRPDVDVEVFEAPYEVKLKSPPRTDTRESSFLLELGVEKDSVDLPDPEITYRVNGRRILKSRGFDEEAVFDGDETLGITRRFDLQPGLNVIEAGLIYKGAEIATQRVEVFRQSDPAQEQAAAARDLWFFGVGVSDYEISSQNLNFAHRDASELAKLLAAQEGRLFDKVHTKVLVNDDATERNVRIQMNEFLDQSGPEDVVVVFIAGHGVTDQEQELYFVTHEADLRKPYSGMPVDRFRNYLENRPINQSALLLLDICHSGAAQGRVVAEDAVQNLIDGTGAVVFASSSGSQLSFEDESFGGGHGAFTAAILEGLKGTADGRVGNRDGFNSLQEMIVFATSRVPELTEGKQRPTIPIVASEIDYALTRRD